MAGGFREEDRRGGDKEGHGEPHFLKEAAGMTKEIFLIAAGLLILTEVTVALLTGGAEDCLLAERPAGRVSQGGVETQALPGYAGYTEERK